MSYFRSLRRYVMSASTLAKHHFHAIDHLQQEAEKKVI